MQVSGKLRFVMTHSVLEEYISWSFSLTPNSTAQPERVKPTPPRFSFFFYYFDMALVILPACNTVFTRYVPLSFKDNLQGAVNIQVSVNVLSKGFLSIQPYSAQTC